MRLLEQLYSEPQAVGRADGDDGEAADDSAAEPRAAHDTRTQHPDRTPKEI